MITIPGKLSTNFRGRICLLQFRTLSLPKGGQDKNRTPQGKKGGRLANEIIPGGNLEANYEDRSNPLDYPHALKKPPTAGREELATPHCGHSLKQMIVLYSVMSSWDSSLFLL